MGVTVSTTWGYGFRVSEQFIAQKDDEQDLPFYEWLYDKLLDYTDLDFDYGYAWDYSPEDEYVIYYKPSMVRKYEVGVHELVRSAIAAHDADISLDAFIKDIGHPEVEYKWYVTVGVG